MTPAQASTRGAAVFLDRDGVINRATVRNGRPHPPSSVDELDILPGVPEALARLRAAGYHLVVVTNQPDIARGITTAAVVDAIHDRLRQDLGLDDIRVCPHDDEDGCACRKPKAGLLRQAPAYDMAASVLVGDRWRDIEAGRAAGCGVTILVDCGYDERSPCTPDVRVNSLAAAVDWLLSRRSVSPLMTLTDLRTRIYADGAELEEMLDLYRQPHIRGFTTNPTLMRRAGVTDYRVFAREVLDAIPDRPISFEVFSDDFDEMERQAMEMAGWGPQVYVKIPVTNTRGEPAFDVVRRLSQAGVKVNVTAVMSLEQVRAAADALSGGAPSYVSVFAGRVADTGRDPVPLMREALALLERAPDADLIWASPREVLNVMQAHDIGCPVITLTADILARLPALGRDLEDFSLETVRMFFDDAAVAGYRL